MCRRANTAGKELFTTVSRGCLGQKSKAGEGYWLVQLAWLHDWPGMLQGQHGWRSALRFDCGPPHACVSYACGHMRNLSPQKAAIQGLFPCMSWAE